MSAPAVGESLDSAGAPGAGSACRPCCPPPPVSASASARSSASYAHWCCMRRRTRARSISCANAALSSVVYRAWYDSRDMLAGTWESVSGGDGSGDAGRGVASAAPATGVSASHPRIVGGARCADAHAGVSPPTGVAGVAGVAGTSSGVSSSPLSPRRVFSSRTPQRCSSRTRWRAVRRISASSPASSAPRYAFSAARRGRCGKKSRWMMRESPLVYVSSSSTSCPRRERSPTRGGATLPPRSVSSDGCMLGGVGRCSGGGGRDE